MKLKPLEWMGSSKEDLIDFPDEVRRVMGFALYLAQQGERHESTKILKGFGGAGILEIIDNDSAGTYRTVYTVKIADTIVVLHAFQKKSKQGIKTPKQEIDLITKRLKEALNLFKK